MTGPSSSRRSSSGSSSSRRRGGGDCLHSSRLLSFVSWRFAVLLVVAAVLCVSPSVVVVVEGATVYALYNVPPVAVTIQTQRTSTLDEALSQSQQTTTTTADGLTLLSETNGHNSGLSFPLRSITQSFLYEQFKSQISRLETQFNQLEEDDNDDDGGLGTSSSSSSMPFDWFNMYQRFVGVDLRVQLYLVRTFQQDDADEDPLRHQRHLKRRNLVAMVELRAELYGSVAFEEPQDKTDKPSNDQVYQMFGQWMQTIFTTTQRDAYLRVLVQSNQDWLRQIAQLNIAITGLTGSGSGSTGGNSNTGTGTGSGTISNQNDWPASSSSSSPTSTSTSTYGRGWSERTEKALFTILILLGVLGVVWAMLAVRQRLRYKFGMFGRHNRNMEYVEDGELQLEGTGEEDDNDDDYNFNAHSVGRSGGGAANKSNRSILSRPSFLTAKDRSSSMDAVRHGSDVFHRSSVSGAMSVLHNTDRYLSKHRPDLFDDPANDHDNNGNGGIPSSIQVFGREYSIPANPFEYIYSAFSTETSSQQQQQQQGFMVSPQGAFSAPTPSPSSSVYGGRRSSLEEVHRANIAAMKPFDEEMDEDEQQQQEQYRRNNITMAQAQYNNGDYYNNNSYPMPSQTPGYRPISSIWRNLTHMWDYDTNGRSMRPQPNDDGIMMQTPQHSMDGQGHHHHQQQQYYHDDPDGGDNALELQTVQFYDDEEDPADYNFAFKDFPRHDGTPCLIFNENGVVAGLSSSSASLLTPKQRQIFEIGSFGSPTQDQQQQQTSSLNKMTTAADQSDFHTTPVSNDAFARMLAEQAQQQQQQSYSPTGNASASFIEGTESFFVDEPSVALSSLDDDITMGGSSDNSTNPMVMAKSPDFRDKLGRLMQQKHRQYEKKAIVEKHQERRAKERKSVREQEKREKHKAMERQIEDMEKAFTSPLLAASSDPQHSPKPSAATTATTTVAATTTTTATTASASSRWASSPNPYQQSHPGQQHQPGQRYSPKPSPYRQQQHQQQQPHGSYSPYRTAGASSPTNNSRARPSPSRGVGRSDSYDRNGGNHHHNSNNSQSPYRYATNTIAEADPSSSPPPSLAPPDEMDLRLDSNSDHRAAPFRMRPRTTQPHGSASAAAPSNDLLYETTTGTSNLSYAEQYRRLGGGMDHSTLKKLSMPMSMGAAGSSVGKNNSHTASNMSRNSLSLGSAGAKKYSPNSVMDDLFSGPPAASISRRKGSFGGGSSSSSVGGSNAAGMAAYQQQQQQFQQQQQSSSSNHPQFLHRRVSSMDHKDSIGSMNNSFSGFERPLPQQRRGRGNKKQQQQQQQQPQQHHSHHQRALTPTRHDVRTTLNGGRLRSSTPTRGGGGGARGGVSSSSGAMPGRPLTPLTYYNQHRSEAVDPRTAMQHEYHSSSSSSLSSSVARGGGGRNGGSSSSLGGGGGGGHSRSASLTDPVFTHGIVTQSSRFV